MLKIFPLSFFDFLITSFKVFNVVFHISFGLCSTQPLFGKYCVNSFWDEKIGFPFKSKRIDLFEVVPASIDIINFLKSNSYKIYNINDLNNEFDFENNKIENVINLYATL